METAKAVAQRIKNEAYWNRRFSSDALLQIQEEVGPLAFDEGVELFVKEFPRLSLGMVYAAIDAARGRTLTNL